jgi:hypothetical protein
MVKNMLEILEILAATLWGFLTAYATWYFTSAKNFAPITVNDVRILWKIHKRNIQCHARKWQEIRRGGKIIGFRCECGYKHVQKRPIVSSMPTPNIKSQDSQRSTFEKLHASYRSK